MDHVLITLYLPMAMLTGENRIMVGLPSVENREMILRTLLAKEKVKEGLDFRELATMTEGYSGSDIKVGIANYIFVGWLFNAELCLIYMVLLSHRTCAQQLLIGL